MPVTSSSAWPWVKGKLHQGYLENIASAQSTGPYDPSVFIKISPSPGSFHYMFNDPISRDGCSRFLSSCNKKVTVETKGVVGKIARFNGIGYPWERSFK